jgi:hypothetical protein
MHAVLALLRLLMAGRSIMPAKAKRSYRSPAQLSREELWAISVLLVVISVLFLAAFAGHMAAAASSHA